jgi:hypothetical protein
MNNAELISIISDAIAMGDARIDQGSDPRNMGEVLTGLAGLIELRQHLRQRNPDAIADELVALGIKPHEFLHILRAAWARSI